MDILEHFNLFNLDKGLNWKWFCLETKLNYNFFLFSFCLDSPLISALCNHPQQIKTIGL